MYTEISLLLFQLRKQENKLAAGYAIFPKSLGDFPQSLQSQEGVEHSAAKQDHLSDKPWSGRGRAHEKFKHNRKIYSVLSSIHPNMSVYCHRDLLERIAMCLIWNCMCFTSTGNQHMGERTTVPQWCFSKLKACEISDTDCAKYNSPWSQRVQASSWGREWTIKKKRLTFCCCCKNTKGC